MSNPGEMSRDRVRFDLSTQKRGSSSTNRGNRKTTADLCRETLDLDITKYRDLDMKPVTVVCRPSQFARFLIKRDEYGFANSFKTLNAELFTPVEPATPRLVDVSRRTNKLHSPEMVIGEDE